MNQEAIANILIQQGGRCFNPINIKCSDCPIEKSCTGIGDLEKIKQLAQEYLDSTKPDIPDAGNFDEHIHEVANCDRSESPLETYLKKIIIEALEEYEKRKKS